MPLGGDHENGHRPILIADSDQVEPVGGDSRGQIRPLIEEADEAAAEVHRHVEIHDAPSCTITSGPTSSTTIIEGHRHDGPDDEEIELHPGAVVYVPRGVRHKAVGRLTVLTICIPRGVLHDIHEVE